MAVFNEAGGGGGIFSGVSSGIRNISSGMSAASRSASRPRPKKKRSSSGYKNRGQATSAAARARNRGNSYGAGGRSFAARPPAGNTPSGTIARSVAPPPPPISVQDFIAGDRTYQGQSSAYKKALADYAAQMKAEQNKYTGEYDAQTKQLGLDRTTGLEDLQNDYASRGLLTSGVYADAMGDFNKKYDTSLADLARARSAYMDDLTTGQTNFQSTQKTLLDKAYQDALNRRLEQIRG